MLNDVVVDDATHGGAYDDLFPFFFFFFFFVGYLRLWEWSICLSVGSRCKASEPDVHSNRFSPAAVARIDDRYSTHFWRRWKRKKLMNSHLNADSMENRTPGRRARELFMFCHGRLRAFRLMRLRFALSFKLFPFEFDSHGSSDGRIFRMGLRSGKVGSQFLLPASTLCRYHSQARRNEITIHLSFGLYLLGGRNRNFRGNKKRNNITNFVRSDGLYAPHRTAPHRTAGDQWSLQFRDACFLPGVVAASIFVVVMNCGDFSIDV